MIRLVSILFLIGIVGCEKDEELSKARTLWGQWQTTETYVVLDNPSGKRLSTTTNNFKIVFKHTNKGYFIGQNNQKFLWAVQDDPDALIISPELFSLDSNNVLHFNTTDLFYIREFSSEEIILHNEFITQNDSLNVTIQRDWVLIPD